MLNHGFLRNGYLGVCLVLLGFASVSRATEISWKRDLQQAATESVRRNKPLLVKIGAAWCGFCHKMNQETFADRRIVEHVSGCFIPVHLDADNSRPVIKALGVRSLPATVIIAPDMKVVRKITGFKNAEQLDAHLGTFCKHPQ